MESVLALIWLLFQEKQRETEEIGKIGENRGKRRGRREDLEPSSSKEELDRK